jgi:hypothetical protein
VRIRLAHLFDTVLADLPLERDEVAVDSDRGAELGGAEQVLEFDQEGFVAFGSGAGLMERSPSSRLSIAGRPAMIRSSSVRAGRR